MRATDCAQAAAVEKRVTAQITLRHRSVVSRRLNELHTRARMARSVTQKHRPVRSARGRSVRLVQWCLEGGGGADCHHSEDHGERGFCVKTLIHESDQCDHAKTENPVVVLAVVTRLPTRQIEAEAEESDVQMRFRDGPRRSGWLTAVARVRVSSVVRVTLPVMVLMRVRMAVRSRVDRLFVVFVRNTPAVVSVPDRWRQHQRY